MPCVLQCNFVLFQYLINKSNFMMICMVVNSLSSSLPTPPFFLDFKTSWTFERFVFLDYSHFYCIPSHYVFLNTLNLRIFCIYEHSVFRISHLHLSAARSEHSVVLIPRLCLGIPYNRYVILRGKKRKKEKKMEECRRGEKWR